MSLNKLKKKLEEKVLLYSEDAEVRVLKVLNFDKFAIKNKDLLKAVLPLLREIYKDWCKGVHEAVRAPVTGEKDIVEFPDFIEKLLEENK